jgi:hypothetical protein
MTVSARYILAALAFGVAALGFLLLPVDADARTQREAPQCSGSGGCGGHQPPPCTHGCNPPPPVCCDRPPVVVPPPHVPPPNIVVVNAGAGARASASAIAIAIANAGSGGDTIIRSSTIMQGSSAATVNSAALSVTDGSGAQGDAEGERELLIQAICLDATNNPHPASQTFGESDVAIDYSGEIYRCMAGTRMRYTMQGRSYDCAQGEALWYENGRVECRTQIVRRPCNERSLLRRFGPGDKFVAVRGAEQSAMRTETTFNGAMTMDGGVGQGVW